MSSHEGVAPDAPKGGAPVNAQSLAGRASCAVAVIQHLYGTVLVRDKSEVRMGPEEGSNQSRQARGVIRRSLTVSADLLARIFDDEDHSANEHREIIIGHSARLRLLVVCFSAREDTVPIFSP